MENKKHIVDMRLIKSEKITQRAIETISNPNGTVITQEVVRELDNITGELKTTTKILSHYKDPNQMYWQYTEDLLEMLDIIGNAKTKALFYILKNMNEDNVIVGSILHISRKSGIDRLTITDLFNELEKKIDKTDGTPTPMIKKIGVNEWQLSPSLANRQNKLGKFILMKEYLLAENKTSVPKLIAPEQSDRIAKLLELRPEFFLKENGRVYKMKNMANGKKVEQALSDKEIEYYINQK